METQTRTQTLNLFFKPSGLLLARAVHLRLQPPQAPPSLYLALQFLLSAIPLPLSSV